MFWKWGYCGYSRQYPHSRKRMLMKRSKEHNNEFINSFLYGYDKKMILIKQNKGELYKRTERTF